MKSLLAWGSLLVVGAGLTMNCGPMGPDEICGPETPVVIACGVGACHTLLPGCVNGSLNGCPAIVTTANEICDGIDNDCNGLVDEGCLCMEGRVQNCYSGAPLTRNVGACAMGVQTCTNGLWSDCVGDVLPEVENCNDAFDNDCDGKVNEDCSCEEVVPRVCYGGPPQTKDVGNCHAGVQTCVNGLWGECKSDIVPGNEVCDGIDNNCDGRVDEFGGGDCYEGDRVWCYTGDETLLDVGICKAGYFVCHICHFDTTTCIDEVLPAVETCNGLDDDCNGVVDDFPMTPGAGCCFEDGLKNGHETDVDCGSACTNRCADGKTCVHDDDCTSGSCRNGICAAP